jgi:hypothetical protein
MKKAVACLVIVAFSFLSLVVAPVQAAMVGTADILKAQSDDLARQKVKLFMERQDVVQQMQTWGVNPEEAQARVDTMTDEEISLLAAKIDQLPSAGSDALGFILAVAVIIFVVLIITDIMGVTDVFTFINKR